MQRRRVSYLNYRFLPNLAKLMDMGFWNGNTSRSRTQRTICPLWIPFAFFSRTSDQIERGVDIRREKKKLVRSLEGI
jgi:hypothetical protein